MIPLDASRSSGLWMSGGERPDRASRNIPTRASGTANAPVAFALCRFELIDCRQCETYTAYCSFFAQSLRPDAVTSAGSR